jgi:hypothetical protein
MSRWTRAASTNSQEEAIEQIEKILAKLGKKICGGDTIGKSPQTIILDLTHQGGEIYVNSAGEVRIHGDDVDLDIDSVRQALAKAR